MPHVREAQALVVASEDPIAVRGRDQLVRRAESVVGVFERALGEAEGEGALGGQELNLEPRIRERLTGLGRKSGVYVAEDEETTATTEWGEEDAEAKRPNRDKVLLNELFDARSSRRRTNLGDLYKHAFV